MRRTQASRAHGARGVFTPAFDATLPPLHIYMFASMASWRAWVLAPLMLSICFLFFHCDRKERRSGRQEREPTREVAVSSVAYACVHQRAARPVTPALPLSAPCRDNLPPRASSLAPTACIMMTTNGRGDAQALLPLTKWKDGSARTPWERINLSASGLLSPITCAVHRPRKRDVISRAAIEKIPHESQGADA